MKIPLYNRIIRAFIVERQLRLRIFTVLLLLTVLYFQLICRREADEKLSRLRLESQLIMQIPLLERKLREQERLAYLENLSRQLEEEKRRRLLRAGANLPPQVFSEGTKPVVKGDSLPILEGITVINGGKAVLLNGAIYEEGQSIDNFTLLKISENQVFLLNEKTKELHKLLLDNLFE